MEFCAFIRLQYHFFPFIPITTSHMVFISNLWENEDFLLTFQTMTKFYGRHSSSHVGFFFNTYSKLCELITLIASILMQCLNCHDFHPKVPNYITSYFQNLDQLLITLIVDVYQLLSPLTYDVIVVAHNFQCLPMTPSMFCHLC